MESSNTLDAFEVNQSRDLRVGYRALRFNQEVKACSVQAIGFFKKISKRQLLIVLNEIDRPDTHRRLFHVSSKPTDVSTESELGSP